MAESARAARLGIRTERARRSREAWATLVLGRFLVPRAVIFADHHLVNSGPFRAMRHPICSRILALWLGAALG